MLRARLHPLIIYTLYEGTSVPDDLVERLRERAKRHHRSLQGELVAILEETVAPRKLTLDELVQRVQDRNVLTGGNADLYAMNAVADWVLAELWDNEKDAQYDYL